MRSLKEGRTMRNVKVLSVLAVLAGVAVVLAVAAQAQPEAGVTVWRQPEQVVFYTIYRGPHEELEIPMMQLFHDAAKRGLQLQPGLGVSFVFLNNPELVEDGHYLTEVRIPVDEGALAQAGTFGDFTDVKRISATEVASVIKPAGVTDRAPYMARLATWMVENGYVLFDNFYEVPHGQGPAAESEIAFPVRKVAE
jgi:effector-binding domain-containing protein